VTAPSALEELSGRAYLRLVAGMAAATGLLFASLLFAALLVGTSGLDAIPAAVFAAAAAWLTRTALDRRLGQ
jgi:hypothetical protein